MECYLSMMTACVHLEGIKLSDKSDGERQTPCDFIHIWDIKKNEQTEKSHEYTKPKRNKH